MQPSLQADGDEITSTGAHGTFDIRLVGLTLHSNNRYLGVIAVFLFDDLANCVGIVIAVQYEEFDVFRGKRVGQGIWAGYPMAMRAMARIAPALPLIGGGDTLFQPVYVCDVADAVVAALADPNTAGRIYELGGPQIYSFRQLLELLLTVIDRKRLLVPVPFWVAMAQAFFLELLPVPPLTRDQVRLLRQDNIVTEGVAGFADFGISPTAPEVILPTYLSRFRRGGAKKGVAAETTSIV